MMDDEEDIKTMEEYVVDLEKVEEEEEENRSMVMYESDCHGSQHSQVYTMYHGTTMQNAYNIRQCGFIPSPDGMLGRGVYMSRSFEKARRYPLYPGGQPLAVLRLKVQVGKVKKINYQGHPLQKTWHLHGYDTAWVPPHCGMVRSGLEEDCVYDPGRITVLDISPNTTR